MTTHDIIKEADLLSRSTIYHAVRMTKQPPLSATHDAMVKKFNRLMKPMEKS